jgi:hypothetical protein
MTVDEHVREVYAWFGLAVYCGQVLEHGVVNAMVTLRLPKRERFTRGDIDMFMDRQFEKTLGRLIKELQAEMPLPADLEESLRKALETRNWLCHDYFRERAVEFMTEAGRNGMLAELAHARELLVRADRSLTSVVQPIADRHGLTTAAIRAEYEAMCAEHGIGAEPT